MRGLHPPQVRIAIVCDLECQFTALREFTLNGTGHATHRGQGSMIRRYIAWRNRHTADPRLRRIIKRVGAA